MARLIGSQPLVGLIELSFSLHAMLPKYNSAELISDFPLYVMPLGTIQPNLI